MGRIIAVSNQKGGVGKTTTCINLAASMAILGKEMLLVDFDPQGNTTSGLGLVPGECKRNIYQALIGESPVREQIRKTTVKRLSIVPANIDLTGAEVELVNAENRELRLKAVLSEIKGEYDFIIIDCPPSLGLLTVNALAAADGILIPLQCEYYAMEGISQLLITINLIRDTLNPGIRIEGILPTMFDVRNNISKQVIEEVRLHLKEHVLESVIPRNVRLCEAPSFGKPVFFYDRTSKGTVAYLKLAKEILERNRQTS